MTIRCPSDFFFARKRESHVAMPPKLFPSCAFTNQRSAYGKRRKAGECLMTQKHFDNKVVCGRYTICEKCHLAMCVECLEKITEQVEKLELSGRVILPNDVWTSLRGRCYRAGRKGFAGFRPAAAGDGGRWTIACPICVSVDLEPPVPRVPRTTSGLPYATMPPKLLKHWKGIVRAPMVVENQSSGVIRSHSVEVFVYEQIVDDVEASLAFRRLPAFGDYIVFWEPPTPSPGVDEGALNIRIIAGKPLDGSPLVLLSP